MAEAFFSNGVINSGGGLSLGASASLPGGQIFGRFYLDTSTGDFYFDDGTQWIAVGGGITPITPDLQAVTNQGNITTNGIEAASYVGKDILCQTFGVLGVNLYSQGISVSRFFSIDSNTGPLTNVGLVGGSDITNQFNYNDPVNRVFTSLSIRQSICNQTFINTTNFSVQYNTTDISSNFYSKLNTINSVVGGTMSFQTWSNYVIDIDTPQFGITFLNRYGLYIKDFRNTNGNYTNIYSIYSIGSTIPMYHAGIGFFGTLTNLATTNVSLSLGKPINFENSISGTAGGSSGQHLIIYANGTQYKIQLLNP